MDKINLIINVKYMDKWMPKYFRQIILLFIAVILSIPISSCANDAHSKEELIQYVIDGRDGIDGHDGADGKDGRDGIDGRDGADGKDGRDGIDGRDGADEKNGGINWWNIGIAIIALIIALLTFIWRINRGDYIHFSKLWYELKKDTIHNPEWIDPEYTTFYKIDNNDLPKEQSSYDAFAWSSWALIQDFYETLNNRSKALSFIMCIANSATRKKSYDELFEFMDSVSRTYEYHICWLESNIYRFLGSDVDIDNNRFMEWLYELGERDVVKVDNSKSGGKGLFAKKNIIKGEFIGRFKGNIVNSSGTHTLQIGFYTHLEVDNDLRYLNHSFNQNAVILGLNLYAAKNIDEGEEIFINYNATEFNISNGFIDQVSQIPIVGYRNLSVLEKNAMNEYTHIWIRKYQKSLTHDFQIKRDSVD